MDQPARLGVKKESTMTVLAVSPVLLTKNGIQIQTLVSHIAAQATNTSTKIAILAAPTKTQQTESVNASSTRYIMVQLVCKNAPLVTTKQDTAV